ncbi:hypothetical protein ACFU7Y_03950 [Kitasatospora sp. NPDC057542]|uniref:hypothetical protein n=1 Tax=Streptomycetaceae TaxID=2062 RepID=UPI001CCECEB2|nr:hypothetical protein [Streptomyces sp. LS1784]
MTAPVSDAPVVAGRLGSHPGVVACMWIGMVGSFPTALPVIGVDRLIQETTSSTPAPLQNV